MTPSATQFVRSLERLRRAWPNSPILDKEMRVTSRRGWLYGLRLAYVVLLGIFTAIVWGATTSGLTINIAAARAADAGKHIINSILWFQFLVAQGITIVLLSGSVSGEIRRRTLPLLLTTPLSFFQIVWEKVVGGLSYVMILLLCCLPLLSIVRVFGGVPWGFVLTGLAVTVTACLLAGTVATYFSILTGSSFAAALLSLVAVAGYNLAGWMDVPVILIVLDISICWVLFKRREGKRPRARSALLSFLRVLGGVYVLMMVFGGWALGVYKGMVLTLSPGFALYRSSENMMVPGKQVAPALMLAIHCAATALVSFALLRRCAFRLRQVARSRIWGLEPLVDLYPNDDPAAAAKAISELDLPRFAKESAAAVTQLAAEVVASARVWPTSAPASQAARDAAWTPPLAGERLGSALLWKDTRRMFFQNDVLRFFTQFLPLNVMGMVYLFSLMAVAFRHIAWHTVILSIYVVAGTAMTAIFSAITISSERQSRTWPILLTTGLSDWHILWAKGAGVFYRCLPAWGPLLIHAAVFTALLQLDPFALTGMVMLVAWIHVFLCGTGFYFSMVLRGTSLPLIANLATAGFLWLIVPGLAPLAGEALGAGNVPDAVAGRLGALQAMTPVGQTITVIRATPGVWSLDAPTSADQARIFGRTAQEEAPLVGVLSLAVYGSLGALFFWRARVRFRRNAFV
jgi:ABC-type transport system involved in multi-copper enzyme maturation permease subunit